MGMAFESWVDRRIREAQERGAFDNLPGAGKPLKNLDRRDDDWWVKDLMAREQLSFVLPTSLALRKEVEDLPKTLAPLWREDDVRELIEDLNARIVEARRRPTSGPPVFIKTVDVEQALTAWRAEMSGARERAGVAASRASSSAYEATSRPCPGAVKCLSSTSVSTVRAASPSPLIMITKPDLRSGSNIIAEYIPPRVPVCDTVHWPSTSASRKPNA